MLPYRAASFRPILQCHGRALIFFCHMFFFLSKIFSLFFLPYPFFYFCGLFGLLAYRRRIRGRKQRWPLLLYLLFGIVSTDVVANGLLRSLEDRLPQRSINEATPVDAAFVLGAISNPLASVDDRPQFTDGVDRLLVAMELFRAGRVQYIVLTGRSSMINHRGSAESEDLKRYLIMQGFPADRILIDAQSRNTAENFLYGLQVAEKKNLRTFYLITSAFHMYRAVHTFEKLRAEHFSDSLVMHPFPVDYRSDRIVSGIEAFVPAAHSAYKSSLAIKEFIGLFAYAFKGYIGLESLLADFVPGL